MAKRKSSKKPKVKLSSSKVIILCAVIISVCIVMLTFSILFNAPNQPKVVKEQTITEPKEKAKQSVKTPAEEKPKAPATKKTVETKQPVVKTPLESEKPKTTVPKSSPEKKVEEQVVPQKTKEVPLAPPQKKIEEIIIPESVNNSVLVFVFDDGGQNLSHLDKFITLPFPITVAVLPGLAHSVESAQKVRKSGNELMLHQPMQAINQSVNPGPGAILPTMHSDEAAQVIFKNISEIGPVAGFNNHEGSLILENKMLVEAILEAAMACDVFFLDSRTTAQTYAPQVASELGIRIYSRDIFLDNEQTRKNVLSELQKGLSVANKKGYCILIGHVWSAQFLPAILAEFYPELVKKGYRFSVVSQSGAER